jgi:hypothetical protein
MLTISLNELAAGCAVFPNDMHYSDERCVVCSFLPETKWFHDLICCSVSCQRNFEVCGQVFGCQWSGPKKDLARHHCIMKNPDEVYHLALMLGDAINRLSNNPQPTVYVHNSVDPDVVYEVVES